MLNLQHLTFYLHQATDQARIKNIKRSYFAIKNVT